MVKVPAIGVMFWVIKLLSTAMGESTSDYLVNRIDPVVAVGLGGVCLVAALVIQLRARGYVPWIYWLAVVMVAITGTMAADVLHIQFGVPYAVSTPFFAAVLAVVFIAWHRTEGTLSIHSIDSPRREAFYWATVMSTFAMGTALGDLTATTLHLGYLVSAVLFAGLMVIPAAGYRFFGLNAILAFWCRWPGTRRRSGGLRFCRPDRRLCRLPHRARWTGSPRRHKVRLRPASMQYSLSSRGHSR
jgi:uncharacterized membrane-anchored protein